MIETFRRGYLELQCPLEKIQTLRCQLYLVWLSTWASVSLTPALAKRSLTPKPCKHSSSAGHAGKKDLSGLGCEIHPSHGFHGFSSLCSGSCCRARGFRSPWYLLQQTPAWKQPMSWFVTWLLNAVLLGDTQHFFNKRPEREEETFFPPCAEVHDPTLHSHTAVSSG